MHGNHIDGEGACPCFEGRLMKRVYAYETGTDWTHFTVLFTSKDAV